MYVTSLAVCLSLGLKAKSIVSRYYSTTCTSWWGVFFFLWCCQPKSSRSKFHPPCAQDHEKQHRLLTSDTTPHSRLLLKDLIDSIHCASVFYGDHLHHDPHTIFLLLLLRVDDVTLRWGDRKKKSGVHWRLKIIASEWIEKVIRN